MTEDDPVYVCGVCGSDDIRVTAWIDPNTDKPTGSVWDGDSSVCENCDAEGTIVTRDEYLNTQTQVSEDPEVRRLQGMIITKESHLDHGLTGAHIAWLLKQFEDRVEFFIRTVKIPLNLPSLSCALWGPARNDPPVPDKDTYLRVRGDRPGKSRMCGRPMRQTRLLTVIAGPLGDDPCVLYTAYGGPVAPREPFDPGLDAKGRAESEAFWAEHALSGDVELP